MEKSMDYPEENMRCTNCISGRTELLTFERNVLKHSEQTAERENNLPYQGSGLIDLQVNGINGIDFNDPGLTPQDFIQATHYLLSQGITTFLPTVITNSEENIREIVQIILQACISDSLVNDCVYGIHLEGPFISPEPGAKGAHDEKYIKRPDWNLFSRLQAAAGGKIKLITLAPEWEGSVEFIEKCREHGVLVSIGHTMADTEQICRAIKAGASLSTHLGNAVPLLLPRHPNMIWDQLAADELSACIITDGLHIPDSFIRVVMKVKGHATLLISDATCFAGMQPGEYENHIGGTVILDHNKRVSLKNTPGLLAGAAKSLLENVEYLMSRQLATMGEAWQMASKNVTDILAANDHAFLRQNDRVIFQVIENRIQIIRVIKSGTIVFERPRH